MKTVLKFDTGADGFKKMIYILAVFAILVLIVGAIFLNIVIKDMGRF